MKKKVIAIIVLVVVGAGIFGLNRLNKAKNTKSTVKTADVTQGDLEVYLSSSAPVKSQEVKDYYGAQAKVSKVDVKVGDTVKKGQVLVQYDAQDLETPVKQAKLQYDNAILQKQDLSNKDSDINKNKADIDKQIKDINAEINKIKNDPTGAMKLQELNAKKSTLESQKKALIPISSTQYKQAENSINSAKLALDSAKANAAKNITNITSDMDGVVTAVNVEQGAVGSVQAAVTVQSVTSLKLTLSLSKYDASKVAMDQQATIKSNGKSYNGKVTYIAPTAEAAKTSAVAATTGEASLTVDVSITDPAPELKIGFDVDVDILLNDAKNVIKVPTESIKTDKSGKSIVYVVQNNKAVEKEVKKGAQSDTEVQVEGVDVGSKVILNPTDLIKDGSEVK